MRPVCIACRVTGTHSQVRRWANAASAQPLHPIPQSYTLSPSCLCAVQGPVHNSRAATAPEGHTHATSLTLCATYLCKCNHLRDVVLAVLLLPPLSPPSSLTGAMQIGRYTITDQPIDKLHQLVQDLGFTQIATKPSASGSSAAAAGAAAGYGLYSNTGYTPFASDITGPYATYSSLATGYAVDLNGALVSTLPAATPVLNPTAAAAGGFVGASQNPSGAAGMGYYLGGGVGSVPGMVGAAAPANAAGMVGGVDSLAVPNAAAAAGAVGGLAGQQQQQPMQGVAGAAYGSTMPGGYNPAAAAAAGSTLAAPAAAANAAGSSLGGLGALGSSNTAAAAAAGGAFGMLGGGGLGADASSLGGFGGGGSGFGSALGGGLGGGLGGWFGAAAGGGGLGGLGGGLGSFGSMLGGGSSSSFGSSSFVGSSKSAKSSSSEEERPYPISFSGFGRRRRL